MAHGFDVDIAKEYGVDVAIMVNHFDFWLSHNKANRKNEHEGKTWTFNSVSAFLEIFPYWTENQVRRILDIMLKRNILLKDNHNQSKYDRTLWYTFTNEFLSDHKSILQFSQMEVRESKNGFGENNEPIPVEYHITTQLNNHKAPCRFTPPSVQEVELYCKERNNGIDAESFVAFYESKGWMIGKSKMKNWKSAIVTWEKRNPPAKRNSDISIARSIWEEV